MHFVTNFHFQKSDNCYMEPYEKSKFPIFYFQKYFSKCMDFFMMFLKKSTFLVLG